MIWPLPPPDIRYFSSLEKSTSIGTLFALSRPEIGKNHHILIYIYIYIFMLHPLQCLYANIKRRYSLRNVWKLLCITSTRWTMLSSVATAKYLALAEYFTLVQVPRKPDGARNSLKGPWCSIRTSYRWRMDAASWPTTSVLPLVSMATIGWFSWSRVSRTICERKSYSRTMPSFPLKRQHHKKNTWDYFQLHKYSYVYSIHRCVCHQSHGNFVIADNARCAPLTWSRKYQWPMIPTIEPPPCVLRIRCGTLSCQNLATGHYDPLAMKSKELYSWLSTENVLSHGRISWSNGVNLYACQSQCRRCLLSRWCAKTLDIGRSVKNTTTWQTMGCDRWWI